MLFAVGSGFALAMAAPFLHRRWPAAAGWILALLPFGLAGGLLVQAAGAEGGLVRSSYPWIASLGVSLSFRLDGLSLLFGVLIAAVGGLVLIYASAYLAGHPQLGRFYALLLIFMASMLGLVLADNLVGLFLFWELTSVSSYLLIGFDHERERARAAALQALLVTGFGGLALLAGFLLLGQARGTLEISELLAGPAGFPEHASYLPVVILVLVGAFTKSAQFPFHFWLPDAMEAPAPVSAYLHAAAMVKAGVYLLARLSPLLAGTEVWTYLVGGIGAVTMLLGAWLAFRQAGLKRILAYSTVSALGTLMLLLGLATPAAVTAALVFFLAHVLYKGALFLAAGNVEHEAGTGDIRELGGLGASMRATALAAVTAAALMAGLPPTFGFIAKESALAVALESPLAGPLISAALLAASALIIAAAGLVAARPFFGDARAHLGGVHEAPLAMLLGPAALAGGGLLLGLFPQSVGPLVAGAADAVSRAGRPVHLELWHGWNLAVLLSGVSLIAGVLLYAAGRRTGSGSPVDSPGRFGPAAWYRAAVDATLGFAVLQTRWLQSGFLRAYLLIVFVAAAALLAIGMWRFPGALPAPALEAPPFPQVVLVVLVTAAVMAAVTSLSRLGAIAALGVVGYGIALIFLLEGAPDLAITQFIVESLVVVLLVFAFYRLPRFNRISSARARLRDLALAATVGAIMTLLTLSSAGKLLYPRISDYFSDRAWLQARGRNIVNVILVDFRALDTFGEITVIAAAALGVYALLRLRAPGRDQ